MPLPNILFVSLNAVRADVAYSGNFSAKEKLRRMGATFRQAVSSCPLTPISHATVFTGQQPPNHGIRHLLREQRRAHVPTRAERLRTVGYRTGAVVSCAGPNTWYGINRGFDHYDDEIPLLPAGRDPLTRPAALRRARLACEAEFGRSVPGFRLGAVHPHGRMASVNHRNPG